MIKILEVELNMPRHANFRMNSDGDKIRYISIMDDQVLWRKAYDAYETKKNGIIFKDHPYVSKSKIINPGLSNNGCRKNKKSLFPEC